MCNITKCCTEVCPEHIKITDNAIIPMKERVVDTQYDPLVWLGNKIPRRSAVAANRALSHGDLAPAEQARASPAARQARRPPGAVRTQRRVARPGPVRRRRRRRRAPWSRTPDGHAPPGWTPCRLHAFVLLCAVEAGQLDLEANEDEISSAMQQAQRLASTGTVLEGKHALHHLVHGRLGRGGGARTRGDRVGPRPTDARRRPRHAVRGAGGARRERGGARPRCARPRASGRTTRGWPVRAPTWRR